MTITEESQYAGLKQKEKRLREVLLKRQSDFAVIQRLIDLLEAEIAGCIVEMKVLEIGAKQHAG